MASQRAFRTFQKAVRLSQSFPEFSGPPRSRVHKDEQMVLMVLIVNQELQMFILMLNHFKTFVIEIKIEHQITCLIVRLWLLQS